MSAYYNEHDKNAAAWLRELIKAGAIAPGDVDERSIADVSAADVRGYTQCHFFAGIAGWSHALRLAGRRDGPVWTGSCPCQSFSAAGAGGGFDDPRHLWPAWFRLIRELRPPTVIGEQVEAAIGWGWWDLVAMDLEGEAYACGAAVLGACCVGAPHIRKRLFWVAHTENADWGRGERGAQAGTGQNRQRRGRTSSRSADGGLADAEHSEWRPSDAGGYDGDGPHAGGPQGAGGPGERGQTDRLEHAPERGRGIVGDAAWPRSGGHADGAEQPSGVGDAREPGFQERERNRGIQPGEDGADAGPAAQRGGPLAGFWADAVWIPCRDGKLRPIPGATQPLPEQVADVAPADLGRVRHQGVEVYAPLQEKAPARTMRLRGYGNAIVAEAAAEFIRAAMEAI